MCSLPLQRLSRLPHSSHSCSPLAARRGVPPADPGGRPAHKYVMNTRASQNVRMGGAQRCTACYIGMGLTCICSGSRSRLWKCDQRSGGSSSGGLRTIGVDSAALELHAGALGGRCCCCVRHDGERQRVCAAAGSAGGVRLSRVSLSHCFHSIKRKQHQLSYHKNVSNHV